MRQSFNKIRSLLIHHGIDPRNKLGQNFLIDLNILDLVLEAAQLEKTDAVLEVGPGTGVLTQRLVELAGFVLSVELDRRFFPIILSQVGPLPTFDLHLGDILSGKNQVDPEVLGKWDQGAKAHGCQKKKLVANLPYAAATPVLANLLVNGTQPERMVGMVQWEIAERFCAEPGSNHYSGLGALVSNLGSAKIHRKIPPTVFFPKPKVDSAILEVRPDPHKWAEVQERLGGCLEGASGPVALRAFLRDLFVHRRKNLRGALCGIPEAKTMGKTGVDSLLELVNLPRDIRAEQLNPSQLLDLCVIWYQKRPRTGP